jgi:hypothetical protein
MDSLSFVTATMEANCQNMAFTSYRSVDGDTPLNKKTKVWEAARATSAAVTFFDPITIQGMKFSDSGFGENNPIYTLENEARHAWNLGLEESLDSRIGCLISLGTGKMTLKPIGDGALELVTTLERIATETEKTAERFYATHGTLVNQNKYYRFNVDRGLENVGLADTEESQIGSIQQNTMYYRQIGEVQGKMNLLAYTVRTNGGMEV